MCTYIIFLSQYHLTLARAYVSVCMCLRRENPFWPQSRLLVVQVVQLCGYLWKCVRVCKNAVPLINLLSRICVVWFFHCVQCSYLVIFDIHLYHYFSSTDSSKNWHTYICMYMWNWDMLLSLNAISFIANILNSISHRAFNSAHFIQIQKYWYAK